MPKPPKQWFRPESKDCPSCFLVLNQEDCYFEHSTKVLLNLQGYLDNEIPKNSTHRHRLLDSVIFNDATLPHYLHDGKLIASLRKKPELLSAARSMTIRHDEPDAQEMILCRLSRGQNSDLPLGLIIANETPTIEKRLNQVVTTLESHLTGVTLPQATALAQANATLPPRYSDDEILKISKQVDRIAPMAKEIAHLTTLVNLLHEENAKLQRTVETIGTIPSLIKAITDMSRETNLTLTSKLTILSHEIQQITSANNALTRNRVERSRTPRAHGRTLSLPDDISPIDAPNCQASSEPQGPRMFKLRTPQSEVTRPPPTTVNESHTSKEVALYPIQRHDSIVETSKDFEQESFTVEELSDDESIAASAASNSRSQTTDSPSESGKRKAKKAATLAPADLTSPTNKNVNDWMFYLEQKSDTLTKPQGLRANSSTLADNVIRRYIAPLKVSSKLEDALFDAVYKDIKARKSSKK
jgi:hypothetical protein